MTMTTITGDLIHNSENNNELDIYDKLCEITTEISLPIVKKVLLQEVDKMQDTDLTEINSFLKIILKYNKDINTDNKDIVFNSIDDILKEGIPEPNQEEIKEQSRDVANVLISSWIWILNRLLRNLPYLECLELTDNLLPDLNQIDQIFIDSLREALYPFSINLSDAFKILNGLSQKLFIHLTIVRLPQNIFIEKSLGKLQACRSKESYEDLALIYIKNKEYNKAIKLCTNAVKIQLKNIKAYIVRGIAYNENNDHELAIKDFNEAINLDPKNPIAYINRGVAYGTLANPNHELAIKDFNEAINLDPKNPIAYINRGVAYYVKGDYSLAIEDYDKAIELDPSNRIAHTNKEFALSALKKYKLVRGRDRVKPVSIYKADLPAQLLSLQPSPAYLSD